MKIVKAEKEFIFDENPSAPSCHASTVLPLDGGKTVLSAWFAGAKEGEDDVGIWFSKRTDGKWSSPVLLTKEKGVPHWNPVLFQREDSSIILYYKFGKHIPYWQTRYIISKDNGETWSEAHDVIKDDTTGGRGPVKNKCIRISNGDVLAPASTEQSGRWRCFIDISHDDGLTFEKQKYIVRPRTAKGLVQMIQPTLWESENGHIHALMRTNKGRIYRSDSADYGKTWTKAYATELPNNNSGIDAVKTDKGTFLLYNPVEENWGARSPVTLAFSADNGKSWTNLKDLDCEGEEFSYPAITAVGNTLYLTYTYLREKIRFWRIEVE